MSFQKNYLHALKTLNNNKDNVFGIHGGGNIGLGLMADVISRSQQKFNIWATSSDTFRNNLINYQHQLWLQQKTKDKDYLTPVNNITMLDAKKPTNIINLYVHSKIVAICLPENGFIASAPLIAKGLIERYRHSGTSLKILILMNKVKSDEFLYQELFKEISKQIQVNETAEVILQNIQFLSTVVDRIVCKVKSEILLKKLKLKLITRTIDECNQNISKTPQLKIPLFIVEKNYNLFVPSALEEASILPGVKKMRNLDMLMDIKNKCINAPHAVLAWLGGLMGHIYISDAINNPILFCFINNLIDYEIHPILLHKYKNIDEQQLLELKQAFIKRCQTINSDTIARVGKDPLRKLNKKSCVRGLLTYKNNLQINIPTPLLELSIAAGILYGCSDLDEKNSDCNKIQKLYQAKHRYEDILFYSGEYSAGKFYGLSPVEDEIAAEKILYAIIKLKNLSSLNVWHRLNLSNINIDNQLCRNIFTNHALHAKKYKLVN